MKTNKKKGYVIQGTNYTYDDNGYSSNGLAVPTVIYLNELKALRKCNELNKSCTNIGSNEEVNGPYSVYEVEYDAD